MKRRPLKKVGEILIEKGLISLEQLTKGLAEQKKHGTSLGSSLVRLGFIEYKKLEALLSEELDKVQNKKIGEILLEAKVISAAQLAEALKIQKIGGKLIGEILVEGGFISAQQLFDALSTQFDVKSVDLDNFLFKNQVVTLLPLESARELKAIPLSIVGERMLVALNEPFNRTLVQKVEAIVKILVEPVFAPMDMLVRAIDREFAVGVPEEEIRVDEKAVSTAENRRDSAQKIIDMLLSRAVNEGASFVHLEPAASGLTVRLRVDGRLESHSPVPEEMTQEVVDDLKEGAKLFVNNRRIIQSGYFSRKFEGQETNFKLSTFPVLTGFDTYREKMTIKMLNREGGLDKLEDLGFYAANFERYAALLEEKSGVIFLAGVADSGITTTLYASLRRLKRDLLNIATIERSIDAFIPGITQTQVDMVKGYSFKEGLRSALLDDADVLMVSEVEDGETANLLFQAALSGRLILSSVHAHDLGSLFKLLKEFAIEPLALSTSLKGVLLQKLVRRICSGCREVFYPADDVLETMRLRPHTPFFRGRGCQACNFTGYKGRVALFELLLPDEAIKSAIASGASGGEISRAAVGAGMATLRMDGLKKVLEGITTIEQVLGNLVHKE